MAAEESDKSFPGSDGANYPFFNAPMNSTTTIRFLPVLDDQGQPDGGQLPWTEKRSIKLAFDGMTNSDNSTTNTVTVTVPCNETWDGKCPITEDIRALWRGSEDEKNLARRFYRRPTFLMQGFVVSSPFAERETPANPIRRFSLNKSIFSIIQTGCMNSEFEDAPWDFVGGRDFKIAKTQQGQWANYSTSSFSYRERALSQTELDAITQYGLHDLSKQLGEQPDKATLDLIYEMYKDSRAGLPFDNAKYGQHFRAYEDRYASAAPAGAAPAPSPAPLSARGSATLAEISARNRGRAAAAEAETAPAA